MGEFKKIDDILSVSGQLTEAEIVMAAGLGFKTIINNRPDGEELAQATSDEVRAWAEKHGLNYHFMPVHPNDLPLDMVVEFGEVYQASETPILAYCTTGMRSSVLWSFMMVVMSDAEIDLILARPKLYGFDLSTLKDPMISVREAIQKQANSL